MSDVRVQFASLLVDRPLILDGATGTELTRRGIATALPLWSTGALLDHPEIVQAIHRDYVEAGADIIVANTFRTNLRTLREAGMEGAGERLNALAVKLARSAIASASGASWDGEAPAEPAQHQLRPPGQPVLAELPLVAASLAPVEDCYHPERVPDEHALRGAHAQMMTWLIAAQPDLIWIETMNTVREASAAAQAAHEHRLPFACSFVINEIGDLLSGERLEAAIEAVEPFAPLAFGLNCIPPDGMTRNLPRLRSATTRPIAAYAHIGNPEPINGWSFSQTVAPPDYAEHARRWRDLGARIIGGCCGTTPEHVRAIRATLRT
jgi:S-methylmethionine-dependent homocysteine/selenocysteine methylase